MSTTNNISSINPFDRLPDELLEKIFFSLGDRLPRTSNNHVRLGSSLHYFDYSIQQPLLKQTHIDLCQVSQVCRRFHHLIKEPLFWERKCREEHVLLPNLRLPIDFTAYEELYVNNPFHPSFNYIKEHKWRRSRNSNLEVQLVPHGSHRLYDEFNRLSPCRATSYTAAHFFQRDIQLLCERPGFHAITHLRPVIEFSICVAGRWDCGSRCAISLFFSDGHQWQTQKVFPQWNDQKWHRLTYHYSQYDQFPSSVTVSITGSDTQFWAGYYGAKFAQICLRLLLRTNENETNAESAVVIEPRDEDGLHQDPEPSSFQDNLPIDNLPVPIVQTQSGMLNFSDESDNNESDDND